jgi:hypothetical protein
VAHGPEGASSGVEEAVDHFDHVLYGFGAFVLSDAPVTHDHESLCCPRDLDVVGDENDV